MKTRAWLVLCLAVVTLVQGCCHRRCCHRRPLFNGARIQKLRHLDAGPTTCCHAGGEVSPHFVPQPLPEPPPAK